MILQESQVKKSSAQHELQCTVSKVLTRLALDEGKKKSDFILFCHIWRPNLHILIVMFLYKYRRGF